MSKSKVGGGISNGLLLGSFFSSGGASGGVCLSDTSWACMAKRFAAVIQTIIMVIFMFAFVAWAYFHRKQIYKAIRK